MASNGLTEADRRRLVEIVDDRKSHIPETQVRRPDLDSPIVAAVRHVVAYECYHNDRHYVRAREIADATDYTPTRVGQALSTLAQFGVVSKWSDRPQATWRIER